MNQTLLFYHKRLKMLNILSSIILIFFKFVFLWESHLQLNHQKDLKLCYQIKLRELKEVEVAVVTEAVKEI